MTKPKKVKSACPLCASGYADAAREMLMLGGTLTEIAASCKVDIIAVESHFKSCSIVPEVGAEETAGLSASDQQLQELLRHSLDAYHASAVTGNWSAVAASLSVRLRCLSEINRRAEIRAAQKTDDELPSDVNDWPEEQRDKFSQFLDNMVTQTNQDLTAINDERDRARIDNAVKSCRIHTDWPLPESIIELCAERGWQIIAKPAVPEEVKQ